MKKIVLDCERMKYANTGLYHFCLQLGKALQQEVTPNEELTYYVRPENKNAFGAAADYRIQKGTDKFLMSSREADIWHCTYQATNYFPFRGKAKKILTIHDLNVLHEEKFGPARIQNEIKKIQKKIDGADHIVAISEFVLNDLRENMQLGNKPTSVIYNGCNFSSVSAVHPPKAMPQADFMFSVGTINAKKNFHVLCPLLENNDKILVIAGMVDDDSYVEKIKAEARRYNAEDRLMLTGAISENDKQWYLQHCEAFLFPSLAEGFGLPVLEAMYFGKPVILSNRTALPEIGGSEAYYFSSFEPQDVQGSYVAAMRDYNANSQKPEAIKKHALSFSWERAASAYMDLYRSL